MLTAASIRCFEYTGIVTGIARAEVEARCKPLLIIKFSSALLPPLTREFLVLSVIAISGCVELPAGVLEPSKFGILI